MAIKTSNCIEIEQKILILPTCSDSRIDNFAIDFIIQTLALRSIAVLSSEHVQPLIQPPLFDSPRPVTTAMELYSSPNSQIAAIQIRSTVKCKSVLARNLIEFAQANNVQEILVVGACSGHLLSGEGLETTSRIRGINVEGLCQSLPAEIHCGGMTKYFVQAGLRIVLAVSSGSIALLSEQLAHAALTTALSIPVKDMQVPQSVKQLITV